MPGRVVYLDSSAIVKRYVREEGTERVTQTFLKAYSGDHLVSYSLWNVGEVLGAFDRARAAKGLSAEDHNLARRRFLSEARRMSRLGLALVVPVRSKILSDAWTALERYHIYEADALQIATALHVASNEFMTGDRSLSRVAQSAGLKSIYLG